MDRKPEPTRRLPRAQRREQILATATDAFARNGFAATGLDDIAGEAGVTRVILYRHFDSKTDLYQAVLDRMCARLDAHVEEPVGGFTDASMDGLIGAAVSRRPGSVAVPARLAGAEFKERIRSSGRRRRLPIGRSPPSCPTRRSRSGRPNSHRGRDRAIIAWLDAGQPDPARASAVRRGSHASSLPRARRRLSLPDLAPMEKRRDRLETNVAKHRQRSEAGLGRSRPATTGSPSTSAELARRYP